MIKSSFICILISLLALEGISQNPLLIPPVMNGPVYNLEMQHGTHTFGPGITTPTMGFNGDILGPTLILNKGDHVDISVLNSIGEETTVHWHGLHVSPENDGGPHSVIDPNSTYRPSFTVLDKASTYWYHPHLHHHTGEHVAKGLSGMIIVKDSEEGELNLPRTYGVDDFPIIIQTKSMDLIADTIRYVRGSVDDDEAPHRDSLVMVNATIDPILNVPKQMVRLRVLNGASHRVFNLGISDNSNFQVIGSDGGLLTEPYTTNRLRMAQGERYELIVDFSVFTEGSTVYLKSYASELPDGLWGASNSKVGGSSHAPYYPNPLNGADFNILAFSVIAQTASPVTSTPSTLAMITRTPPGAASNTRHKYFSTDGGGPKIGSNPDPFLNNLFDINVINDEININTTEIWELHGDPTQAHPFHIHDIQFYVLDRKPSGGSASLPPPYELGRKDVILLMPGETVRFIATFDDFADDEIPYMFHCHILAHEDRGMMGQFIIKSDLYVDKLYIGSESGTISQPFNTFTEAYNVSFDSSSIYFKQGGDHEELGPSIILSHPIKFKLLNGPITIK